MLKRAYEVPGISAIELNLACPNIPGVTAFMLSCAFMLCLHAVPSCCAYMLISFSSYLSYSHPQTSTLHTCLNTQPLVPPLISPVTNTVVLNSDTPPLTSSSTHPVTHPVTHSVTHTLTHSLTLSHTPSHTQPVTHPLTLSHSHLHSHIHTLAYPAG